MKEINGFEIEKYNQYGLDEGATKSTCPKCSNERKKKSIKCLSIDWSIGLANCFHCGERLQLHTYKKKDEKKKEYVKPKFQYRELSEDIIRWFETRGISQQTLSRMSITQGKEWMPQTKKEMNTINFNYFLGEQLVNVKYRDGKKNFKLVSGAEKILYNIDSIKLTRDCVIVEGEIDALSFIEAEVFNVVSIPNGFNLQGNVNLDYLDNYMDYFDNKEKIYLCLDNDEAGQKGKKEFIRRLGSDRCYIVNLGEFKDANEFLCSKSPEELRKCLDNAELSPIEEVVVLNDMSEQLDDFWENGMDRGMIADIPDLDSHFSIDFGQYTLVTGVPQSGKSEFLDHLVVKYNLKYNCKVAYCSVENEPFIFHYDKIFQKIYGCRPEGKYSIEQPSVKDVKDHITNNFFHVKFDKRYWLKDVLDKFGELVRRNGVRIFVLDPFNKIKLKGGSSDVTKYTEEYHLLLDEFVKKYDAHLFLVAHPVKMSLKEGSQKTYNMPSAYNLKGGGEHYDMSYNMLGVNRMYEERLVHVKTLKVKFKHLGENQHDCYLSYNTKNGRYEELEHQNVEAGIEIFAKTLDFNNWLTGENHVIIPDQVPTQIKPNESFDFEFDDPDDY
jgi:twinkle protein